MKKQQIVNFYRKHRAAVLAAFALLVISVLAFFLWPQSRERKIRAAIRSYHVSGLAKSGATVKKIEVANLFYASVPGTWPDSIRFESLTIQAKHFSEMARQYSEITTLKQLSGPAPFADTTDYESLYAGFRDSAAAAIKELSDLAERIKSERGKRPPPTKCDYVLYIDTGDRYTVDSATTLLDSAYRVTWCRLSSLPQ